MKHSHFLPILCMVVLLTTMCKNQSNQAIDPEVKYTGFKSAIITKTFAGEEVKSTEVTYIDNYGDQWFNYLFGVGEESPMLISTATEEYDYYLFPKEKSGWKSKKNDTETISWMNLTDEVIERFQIKKIGQEELLGKMCDMYSLVISSHDPVGVDTAWVWQGIELKQNIHSMEMGSGYYLVTDMQIDVPIPAEKITIPEDFDIDER